MGPEGPDSDHITDDLLKAAARHGRVVSAYYETIRGADLVASATEDLVYLVSKYGAHPAWLKVNGRPVIFVYGRAVGQMGPLERWQEVRAGPEETGSDPFLIGDRIDAESAGVFDGIHTYNTVGLLSELF